MKNGEDVTAKKKKSTEEQQERKYCSQWFRHFKNGVYLDTWEPVETLPEGMHVAGVTAWRLEGGRYVEGYIWQLIGSAGGELWASGNKGPRRDLRF